MKRSSKRGRIAPLAWVLAVGMTAGSLMALFSLIAPEQLTGRWPLGIGAQEVHAYAELLDRRSRDRAHGQAEILRLGADSASATCPELAAGPDWTRHWFMTDGFADSVRVRRLRTSNGGLVIRFQHGSPFRTQREIVLIPADVESIRAKYLQIIAEDLGLVTPEISFVHLHICGVDQGLYLKEERIGREFLEKRRLADAALFTHAADPTRPDHLFPEVYKDSLAAPLLRATLVQAYGALGRGDTEYLFHLLDEQATIGSLLMTWLEGHANGLHNESLFAYRWTTGRILPLYRRSRVDPGPVNEVARRWAVNVYTGALQRASFRAALMARREKLVEQAWRLKERFAAMDQAWLPVLVGDGPLSLAQARAARISAELLDDRLRGSDPLVYLDRPMDHGPGYATHAAGHPQERRHRSAMDDERVLKDLVKRYRVQVSGDTIRFPRGRYAVTEDLVLPQGHAVVLQAGARFEIAPGRSVLCLGGLDVQGTKLNPVFIRPKDERLPFGTFAVHGDGTAQCRINGLQISGGSEARINGVYHSAMLSIHAAASTTLANSIISGSHGEDAVNIKGGRVEVLSCVFQAGWSDLLDLDLVQGSVRGCTFLGARRDANGDGLDLSASRVMVVDSRFIGMADKGLSCGEASQVLVRGCRFERNSTAIASKDLSLVYVQDNVFEDNGTVLDVHRKKPIYGGARAVLYTNTYIGNTRERSVDAYSKVLQEEAPDARTLALFGLK